MHRKTFLSLPGPRLVGAMVLVFIFSVHGVSAAAGLDNLLSQLLTIHDETGPDQAKWFVRSLGLRWREEKGEFLVPIIIEPLSSPVDVPFDRGWLTRRGVRVDAVSRSFVRVLAPFPKVRLLVDHPQARLVRAPSAAKELQIGAGGSCSESVSLTGAHILQLQDITGSGVHVAVVDLGFDTLSEAIAAGELPSAVVRADLPGTNDDEIESRTRHGVAVAEHVADMAPEAVIHCIMVADEVDLENAAAYIRDRKIRIANHSVGWVNASFCDNTGPINAVINNSRTRDGVFWSVAAGNEAKRHWRGKWKDANGNGRLDFVASDEFLTLVPGTDPVIRVFLNWNQYGSSVTDLNLQLLDRKNRLITSSAGKQDGTQSPTETIVSGYCATLAPYRVVVTDAGGEIPDNLEISLYSLNHDMEPAVSTSSLLDPAGAVGAYTVASVGQANWESATPPLAPYSSRGLTNDGRVKPDISAPDGTTGMVHGTQGSLGTSYASATVAGAAALLLCQDSSLTAEGLASALSAMAEDMGSPGKDAAYGAGLLWVRPMNVANQPPAATGDRATVSENNSVDIAVLANDKDRGGGALRVISATRGAHGMTTVNENGTITYRPGNGFSGADRFSYTIVNDRGDTVGALVEVTVSPLRP